MTTTNFAIGALGDSGVVEGTGASYPPSVTVNVTGDLYVSRGKPANYVIDVGLVRFDTSSLNDAATVSAATLNIYIPWYSNDDSHNLCGEWYNAGTIDNADYTTGSATTAFSVAISSLTPAAWNAIPLTTPTNVNLTGYTGFRLTQSGGAPTGANTLVAHGYGSANPATLDVTYNASTPIAATMNVPVTLTMGIKADRDRIRAMNLAVTLSMNGNYTQRAHGSGAMSALSAMSGMIP